MKNLNRRRFLAICAAAGAVGSRANAASVADWQGAALGARSTMRLVGVPSERANTIFRAVEAEISRLEDIFSLYRRNSAITRLNRAGTIDAPPAELLQVCSLTTSIHRASGGSFDPTVQPLWEHIAQTALNNGTYNATAIANARSVVGWEAVRYGPGRMSFGRAGMAITLNGIAQGFITDRIADKLRGFGLTDILIDIGEIRASGVSPDGTPWQAGIAHPDGSCCVKRVTLSDRALATSAPLGTVMDAAGRFGHILDPRSGLTALQTRQVSVSAPRADIADGLSTALCAADPARFPDMLAAFPEARIEDFTAGATL